MPGWLGERLDVAWAISVLHPLAATPVGDASRNRSNDIAGGQLT